MKVAIVNLTAGGMSGGYRKYLKNIIPRLAGHPKMDAILCAAPSQINIHGEFDKLLNVQFVSCKPLHVLHQQEMLNFTQDWSNLDLMSFMYP